MSQIKELMNIPITIDMDSMIGGVTKRMLDKKISRLLVTENEKITSIITEKDLGLFLLKDKSDRTLQQIQLNELARPIMIITQSEGTQ
ncbi:MAG: CBS domain-containing protein [Nitrosopumilus sp.]